MKKIDIGYWISPGGELIESPAQDHAQSVAQIFNIPFVENKTILYYRIAFENNYVRVTKTKDDELTIQLTNPATRKQKTILYDFFEMCKKTLVTYGWYEAEVLSKHQLNKILSGQFNSSKIPA